MSVILKHVPSKILAMAARLGAPRVDVSEADFNFSTFTTTLLRTLSIGMQVAVPARAFTAEELVGQFGSPQSNAGSLLHHPFVVSFKPKPPWPFWQRVYKGDNLEHALEAWRGMGQVLFILAGDQDVAHGLGGAMTLGADVPLALAVALDEAERRGVRLRSVRLLDLSPFARRGVLIGAQGSEKAMWALHAAYAAVMPSAPEGELPTPSLWIEEPDRPDVLLFQLPLRS